MDVIALLGAKKYIDEQVSGFSAMSPFEYQGSVATVADLPATSTKGYCYTVKADNTVRVWDSSEWVRIGDDNTKFVPVTIRSFTSEEKAQARTNIGAIGAEDYATANVGGVIKASASRGTVMSSGALIGTTKTAEEYADASNALFVSKGTLENIKAGGFVPSCTAEDAGKILVVGADGVPAWQTVE